ncbi:MAG: hypothetical protein Q4A28_05380 [Brachymonas sp.]|nr:hypothetical protein [Brachymonas sp.]
MFAATTMRTLGAQILPFLAHKANKCKTSKGASKQHEMARSSKLAVSSGRRFFKFPLIIHSCFNEFDNCLTKNHPRPIGSRSPKANSLSKTCSQDYSTPINIHFDPVTFRLPTSCSKPQGEAIGRGRDAVQGAHFSFMHVAQRPCNTERSGQDWQRSRLPASIIQAPV